MFSLHIMMLSVHLDPCGDWLYLIVAEIQLFVNNKKYPYKRIVISP